MSERILLCLCHMSGREMDFIQDAFDGNWVVPLGPNVNGFEKDLENFLLQSSPNELHEKRIVALSSGTAAIHLGLVGLGVGKDDEVMVQSFTFSASANPVVYQGATPVFIDSEQETWNMDPELLDRAIEDRVKKTGRKPKAIIPVYLYGMPAKIGEIMEVSSKWEIPVLEDSAEAFGSRYDARFCGTFGDFGAFSFNGNKMITTSGGGALICPDESIAKAVLKYATQSREGVPWYEHRQIGFNYRMSNICAGIGRGQMTIAEDHIAHHKKIQELYRQHFKGIEGIELHDNPSPEYDSNFWLCTITFSDDIKIKDDDGCGTPEAMRRKLDVAGIESRQLWKPMHLQPYFKDYPMYINGISENLFKRGLCLPAGPWVGPEEVDKIVSVIKSNIM